MYNSEGWAIFVEELEGVKNELKTRYVNSPLVGPPPDYRAEIRQLDWIIDSPVRLRMALATPPEDAPPSVIADVI
jgi:hypothetical protein